MRFSLLVLDLVHVTYAASLVRSLLDNHYKYCGPPFVNVSVHTQIYQLMEINEADGSFKAYMWMLLEWLDPTLSWKTDQSNLTRVWLSAEEIWKPDVVVYNMLQVFNVLGSSNTEIYVKVDNNGIILWAYPMVYTAACYMDVADFPFDVQTCSLVFGSWNIEGTFLDIYAPYPKPETSNFQANEQWFLGNYSAIRIVNWYTVVDQEMVPFPEVHVTFTFERRAMFYLFTLVLPSSTITLISILGIFTPSQSDGTQTERISLGINALLTMTVFIMTLSDQMPKTSNAIPKLSLFFMMQLILEGFCCFTAACNMRFHYMSQNGHAIPRYLRFLQATKARRSLDINHQVLEFSQMCVHRIQPNVEKSKCSCISRTLRMLHMRHGGCHYCPNGNLVMFDHLAHDALDNHSSCPATFRSSEPISPVPVGKSSGLVDDDGDTDWREVPRRVDRLCLYMYTMLFFLFTTLIFWNHLAAFFVF